MRNVQDRFEEIEARITGLELDNDELKSQLEAVTNELAYVDAYQNNLVMDHENLAAYVFEIEDVVDDLASVIYNDE